MKREWLQPELVVLVKGTAGEDILAGCKESGTVGPDSVAGGCQLIRRGKCKRCKQPGKS